MLARFGVLRKSRLGLESILHLIIPDFACTQTRTQLRTRLKRNSAFYASTCNWWNRLCTANCLLLAAHPRYLTTSIQPYRTASQLLVGRRWSSVVYATSFVPRSAKPHACFLISRAACFRLKLHSSYARPAPKPTPTNAGHALLLNSKTEKTTPKPRPREDLMMRLERQRSH